MNIRQFQIREDGYRFQLQIYTAFQTIATHCHESLTDFVQFEILIIILTCVERRKKCIIIKENIKT